MGYKTICCVSVVVIMVGGVLNVQAQIMNNVAIHGFGGWAYGKTDNENRYLVGDEDGNYDAVNFSLNISAKPYERLSLHIQPSYVETMDGNEVGLDYAFAEWHFSDKLILRAGKVKAPFMLATEVYNVGTIRPFFSLPQGVYQQIAAEAYKGVGITGSFYLKGGWEIQYDVYGGKLSLLPNLTTDAQNLRFEFVTPVVNDLIGGRLTIQTPINGLNAAISAYTGDFKFGQGRNSFFDDRYVLLGTSLEYVTDSLWLRGEYLTQEQSSKAEADVAYVEAAYKFTSHWQAAARYEYTKVNPHSPESQFVPRSLFDHKEVALGMNYWLNPNLVFKLSYHLVKGNRFAAPEKFEDYMQRIQMGGFEENTHLIMVGTQFSF
jgi:hypothetical protein